ncbi:MAG: radical SAM protein [Ginsengibacter sp.]
MKYKLSFYTIFSDPVDLLKNRVAYNTRTGNTAIVSEACYNFLQNGLEEYMPPSIREKLIGKGILTELNENEIETIIRENNTDIKSKGPDKYLYEVIQPTAMCQLGCYYCGQQHTKTNLKDDLVDKIVERIITKFRRGRYKGILIGWFGGEPLLGLPQMRSINKKLRESLDGEDVDIRGKIVTNGLSLKENIFLELVNDFKINNFEVTLDGTEEFHDQHRYTKSKKKSFSLIYRNLQQIMNREDFLSLKCSISIRCNVDEKNIDGVVPLINKLADDGLHQKIAYLYFVNIYSWGGNDANTISLTKEQIAKNQLEWRVLQIKRGYPVSINLPKRKKQICIAVGGDSEMYDAYGNIFNCTEVSYSSVYEEGMYKLGSLKENHLGEFQNKPFNNWNKEIQDGTQAPCHFCRLLPVCGGTCPKSWKEGNPACPPFKYNIKKDLELLYLFNQTPKDKLEGTLDSFVSSLDVKDFIRLT